MLFSKNNRSKKLLECEEGLSKFEIQIKGASCFWTSSSVSFCTLVTPANGVALHASTRSHMRLQTAGPRTVIDYWLVITLLNLDYCDTLAESRCPGSRTSSYKGYHTGYQIEYEESGQLFLEVYQFWYRIGSSKFEILHKINNVRRFLHIFVIPPILRCILVSRLVQYCIKFNTYISHLLVSSAELQSWAIRRLNWHTLYDMTYMMVTVMTKFQFPRNTTTSCLLGAHRTVLKGPFGPCYDKKWTSIKFIP